MEENKLATITNLFEDSIIRSVWDKESEDYYFSVIDVIGALTGSNRTRKYWSDLKLKLKKEGSKLSENIGQLKLKSKDGKYYLTDVLNTEGIFRLIESIPSKKAEPFKLWLAKLGKEEVDNIFDPSKGIDKMIDYYLKHGYSIDWIALRFKAILDRKKLTSTWETNGIKDNIEYAILTNEIYREWSGMTAQEYKKYKNIRKENLRDNMTDIEVALTDLGELATRELVKEYPPNNFNENKELARRGGKIAKQTRNNLESELGKTVLSNSNALKYKYLEDNDMLEK